MFYGIKTYKGVQQNLVIPFFCIKKMNSKIKIPYAPINFSITLYMLPTHFSEISKIFLNFKF